MGADSFADLHQWHNWTYIAKTVPLAFLARPGYSIRALKSPAALRYAACRVPNEDAAHTGRHGAAGLGVRADAAAPRKLDGDPAEATARGKSMRR